jgi:hypothetical protein
MNHAAARVAPATRRQFSCGAAQSGDSDGVRFCCRCDVSDPEANCVRPDGLQTAAALGQANSRENLGPRCRRTDRIGQLLVRPAALPSEV